MVHTEERYKDIVNINNVLTTLTSHSLTTVEAVQELEEKLLAGEQADAPVRHIFGAGIYIRELSAKADTFLIGHRQTMEHMNIMVKGKVLILNNDGTTSILEAPLTRTFPPGRKIGIVLEDMVWQNIYPTDETDIEVLEATYLDKSEYSIKEEKMGLQVEWLMHTKDRESYDEVLKKLKIDHSTVVAETENEGDQIPFPAGSYKLTIGNSPIQGKGMFATSDIKAGEIIAPARVGAMRTPAGRYINHGCKPNAVMAQNRKGDIMVVATTFINGCKGGNLGEEITVDYEQAVRLSRSMV